MTSLSRGWFFVFGKLSEGTSEGTSSHWGKNTPFAHVIGFACANTALEKLNVLAGHVKFV